MSSTPELEKLTTNKDEKITNVNDFFANLIGQIKKDPSDLIKFGIGLITLCITLSVFYYSKTDPKALTDQFYMYVAFGIIPIIIGIVIVSNIFSSSKIKDPLTAYNRLTFYAAILFIFIIAMYMFYRVLNPRSVLYVTYLLGFLSVLVLIIGLAIIYRIFVRTVINARGWMGFFLKTLFLIPCLFIDFMEYAFADLKSTPKMVIVLFILEILIILAYMYVPRITNPSKDSIVLLNNPVFLSKIQSIGKANQLFMKQNDVNNPSKSLTTIRKNYSISMWVYVNQHPNSNAAYSKETSIFRYGYPNSSNGNPKITYYNDRNDPNNTDKFIFYVNQNYDNDASGVSVSIPTQSWNQIVVSYNDLVVDIFVNGSLEKTVSLGSTAGTPSSTTLPIYNDGDIIEVGEGDNTVTNGGLHGAICNVVYHKTPLTPYQISGMYNLNRYKNPPVNK
jgi:hypothetical protein